MSCPRREGERGDLGLLCDVTQPQAGQQSSWREGRGSVEPHLPALSIPQAPEHPQESVPWCLLLTCAECSVQGTHSRPRCPHVRLSLQHKAPLHFAAGASTSDAGNPPLPPLTWGVSVYRKESQALENNFREILFLIEQINVLKALLRETQDGLHNHSWNADGDSSEAQNTTDITDEVQWGWGTGMARVSSWCHLPAGL